MSSTVHTNQSGSREGKYGVKGVHSSQLYSLVIKLKTDCIRRLGQVREGGEEGSWRGMEEHREETRVTSKRREERSNGGENG